MRVFTVLAIFVEFLKYTHFEIEIKTVSTLVVNVYAIGNSMKNLR